VDGSKSMDLNRWHNPIPKYHSNHPHRRATIVLI
jgi:hypothetical protein